jgi:alpha-L-fucosidase 2
LLRIAVLPPLRVSLALNFSKDLWLAWKQSDKTRRMRPPSWHSFYLVAVLGLASMQPNALAQGEEHVSTTAWKAGHFAVDAAGLLGRSDIVLGQPNTKPAEAMPMGNGRLGIAVWAADGFTAQLNRADTLPHRDSPGQIVIPGLAALTSAKDFSGRLDLYNGSLVEHGGGFSLIAYVQVSTDTFVVDVTGADPNTTQTAILRLWEPRKPNATAANKVGMLEQTWIDHYGPEASGETFGALAAITATGREVSVAVNSPRSVTISFKPAQDGHFRVMVASPHYNGANGQLADINRALANSDPKEHIAWWHSFWHRAGLIKLTSGDGSGEYLENLRNLYLYTAAAESGDRFPGSQAGIADLFSAVQDLHHWDPAAFWHWNLRMQVAANIDAGVSELNEPYFRLYRENLANIKDWTSKHMAGRPGICVPETMRFNGAGVEYEGDWNPSKPAVIGLNCDAGSRPYYNARTLSTAAEVSLWIWQQYLATGDRAFLASNYPVMAASAQFLLAYETRGADGKMHTHPSNAHEQQWDTIDPTTDLSARSALFPAVAQAAKLLHTDSQLVQQLDAELSQIPPLPQDEKASASGKQTVIAESYDPAAAAHNEENIGLEPVWPYNLIGDNSPMLALAKSTYATRPYPVHQDWSFDPVQAARLGLSDEVRSTLIALTERYQKYINGFANWGGPEGEFYVEQEGVVALALAEALVQDYDGLIRIAPATPSQWDFEGSVWVRDRTRVDVQVRGGVPTTVAIEAGAPSTLHIRNPWPGQPVEVVDARGKTVLKSAESNLELPVRKGEAYLLRSNAAGAPLTLAPVTGTPSLQLKRLGPVQLGK